MRLFYLAVIFTISLWSIHNIAQLYYRLEAAKWAVATLELNYHAYRGAYQVCRRFNIIDLQDTSTSARPQSPTKKRRLNHRALG